MANSKPSFFDTDAGFKRQHIPLLLFPLLLIYVITFVFPTDLFTTALWWDGQGWALVWTDEVPSIIDKLNQYIPGDASAEAVGFSFGMIAFQFIVTLKIYECGSWLRSGSPIGLVPLLWEIFRKREKMENVNPSKAAWVAMWIFLVAFDGITSYSYRSNPTPRITAVGTVVETAPVLSTLIVHSIFFENILSEIMLGESLRGTVNVLFMLYVWWKRRNEKEVKRTPTSDAASRPASAQVTQGASNQSRSKDNKRNDQHGSGASNRDRQPHGSTAGVSGLTINGVPALPGEGAPISRM